MQSASIIFNDSASQFNKDLTEFLKRNLEVAIKRGQLSFHFKIAKPADLSQLREMGVRKLPAMLIEKTHYVGVPVIIEEIRRRVRNSKQVAPEKTEEEIIREFQMSALGNVKKDADGKFKFDDDADKGDSESAGLMSAFNREISRRGTTLSTNKNGSEVNGPKNIEESAQKPSRNQINDFDDDSLPAKPIIQKRAGPKPVPRSDNIDNPSMNDAYESLKRIGGKNTTSDDAQDDVMMTALLNRMAAD